MKKSSRTFPLFAALLLSRVASVSGDPKQCADDTIAMMQDEKNALGHKAIKMMKSYNKTCESTELCTFNIDEDTNAWLKTATSDEGEPGLPEDPVVADAMLDFEGFLDHPTYKDYVDLCLEKKGYIKFLDANLNLKGTAMELVDVNVQGKLKSFPMCLHKNCQHEDLEEALEWAVKHAIINNAEELSDQQKALIEGMNIALACAASGIEDCSLTVKDTDSLGLSDISSAVRSSARITLMLAGVLGLLVAVM